MFDPTSYLPERLKEKIADSLLESLASSAERLGGEAIADKFRQLSSGDELRRSVENAMGDGIQRFIEEYSERDEDLVAAIQDDELFLEAEVVQDALIALVKRPGAWLQEERETVVRHFETVLPDRRNRERVDKAVSYLLRCIAEEVWSLPGAQEIREIYSLRFQELSAEAQREQLAVSRQQLAVSTQLSADLQGTLLQLMALVEQKALASPLPAAALPMPRPYHNLPQPTYTQFVGRDAELAWLRQRLSPTDRAWQIAVTGIGGVGKSALALAIAHEYRQRYDELSPEERFDAIVWISAKEEVLTAFGCERADVPEQVLHTLEDVYSAISRVLEREDITRAQPGEQNALVMKALQRQRTLLIMDNLESVKDDRIKAFLRHSVPFPTKIIITSRESLDVADVRPLTGLSPEEADELIAEEAWVREVTLTPQQRKRIFELTWGLPLPIKLAVARMAGGESFAAVDRWLGDVDPNSELPEYCVKGQIELVQQRDPNAWTVLMACSLFDRGAGASRQALGEIADLSLADRDGALAQLQRLFLVNRTEADRFWVLPIVQRYASASRLTDFTASVLVTRWLDWLQSFAALHCSEPYESDIEIIGEVSREYPTIKTALTWCWEQHIWYSLNELCKSIWAHAFRVSLFTDLDQILDFWSRAATEQNDDLSLGCTYLQRGRLCQIRRQSVLANTYLDRAELILSQRLDGEWLAELWTTRGQVLFETGSLEESAVLGQAAIDIGVRRQNLVDQIIGVLHLADCALKAGHLAQADKWIDMAEDMGQRLQSPRFLNRVSHRRARLFRQRCQWDAAEKELRRCLELNINFGEKRFEAFDRMDLATVYAETGRIMQAFQMMREARDLFDRLGMLALQARADEILRGLEATAEP